MAGIINLEHLMSGSDGNVVEIYLLPSSQCDSDANVIDISWKTQLNLRGSFMTNGNNGTVQYTRNYYHRDMCYSYDLENDGQKVMRKLAKKEMNVKTSRNGIYAVVFQEESLPPHRFPTTKDITYTEEIKHTTYRINNRLFLYHDEEDDFHTYYIRYQHSENVDFHKMQSDLDRALGKLLRR